MSILSRRMRLLHRAPKAPKMSSRRQFHRALRRHPAWPAVMAEAAARAQAQKDAQRGGRAPRRAGVRGTVRRNRAGVIALIITGALVAGLNGIGGAREGDWRSHIPGDDVNSDGPLPSGRFGAATAWDGNNNEILMFGGFVANPGQAPTPTGDTDTTWGMGTQRKRKWQNRNPIHHPSPRGYASMAYDEARKKIVLFGGAPYRSNAVSNETWTYDGSDWTLLDPPGPRPPARQKASMVYDAHRKVVVMFGGLGALGSPINNGVTYLDGPGPGTLVGGDTWIWNGSAWKELKPAMSPRAKHSAAMTYDACRAEAVLFGGTDGSNRATGGDETWTWNGETWADKKPMLVNDGSIRVADPTLSPTARVGASMAYSHTTGKVLLYGGLSPLGATFAYGSLTATDENVWSWDGSVWEKGIFDPIGPVHGSFQTPSGAGSLPRPRAYASFGYDGKGSGGYRVSLFGGTPMGDAPTLGTPAPAATNAAVNESIRNATPQVALDDQFYFKEESSPLSAQLGLSRCVDPVPLPAEGALVGGESADSSSKAETRDEIHEIGRLPVLLGTDPRTIPAGAPKPDCLRRTAGGTLPAASHKEGVDRTHLATDPKRNRVYQFFACDQEQNPGRLLIQAYDGATLKPLGSAVASIPGFPGFSDTNENSGTRRMRPLHDADRGRFLVPNYYTQEVWVIQQADIDKGAGQLLTASQVEKIDLPRKLKSTDTLASGLPPETGLLTTTLSLKGNLQLRDVGFFNHPKTGLAKLLISYAGENRAGNVTANSNPGSTPSEIVQWDLVGRTVDWRIGVEACLPDYRGAPTGGIRFKDIILTSCDIQGYSTFSSAPVKSGVIRIPVIEDPTAPSGERPGTPEMFPGPDQVLQTWGDPKAERILLLTKRQNPAGKVLWVFDGKASRYVGRVGMTGSEGVGVGPGFDPETGRFYFLIRDYQPYVASSLEIQPDVQRGGLFVTDTRLTPVPQAVIFPQFSYPAQADIGILPPGPGLATRVFVRRASGDTPSDPNNAEQVEKTADRVEKYPDGEAVKLPDEMHYKVLADELPVAQPLPFDQQDALTVPVAESPGKTEVSFDAEGSGYGLRLRKVGGTLSIDVKTDSPCYGTDREVMAGWVANAHLSDLETSARSLGMESDSSSKLDLASPLSRCNVPKTAIPAPGPAAPTYDDLLWPALGTGTGQVDGAVGPHLAWDKHVKEAECVGNVTTVTQTTGADVYGSAKCKQSEGWVNGTARGSALGFTSNDTGFSVGEGYSNVVVAREAGRGVVVTSTAEAKAVKLPGVSIGLIKTIAVTWSNGRPCTANCLPAPALEAHRASFERQICGVVFSSPFPSNSGCLTPAQQQQFLDGLNQLLSRITAKATFPQPDANFLKGTSGGYTSGVTKQLPEAIEDQFFTRDDQQEVPGLKISFNREQAPISPGPFILELAGVRGVTGYGVQCNSDLLYSPSAHNCVPIPEDIFPDDEPIEEEEFSTEEADPLELYAAEGWTPEATAAPERLALGSRIGRYIANLPFIRQLPIRQMGEALLAASVWLLLTLPLALTARRFALNLARKGS